ncbi:hypothetical protein ACQKPE_07555 [Pseudomonas sp. NPDC089554]|uniref:hypothetical protein n=1 Tax=Pseudomonas sp. NPDC089554 TaxID=3390653 RepID=UPI003D05C4D7
MLAVHPRRLRLSPWLLALLLGRAALPEATAAEVTFTAKYRGEASGRFENTTRQAGFCGYWPTHCAGVQTVGLPLNYLKTSIAYAPDARDQFYVKLPGRRTLQVTNPLTRDTYPITFEILGVSQKVQEPSYKNPVFTRYPSGGCAYQVTYWTEQGWTMYLWSVRNPAQPQPCYSNGTEAKRGETFTTPVTEMAVSYKLNMPSPLAMKPGIYHGSATYSVGPGMDFDFGNGVQGLDNNSLTLNFELDVQHAFVIDFPPGSERAVLEPPGGWSGWLSRGQALQKLYRDLLFQIWSSGPFKAYKLCQYPVGDRCGIRNAANHEVPVSVGVSMPGGIRQEGKEVRKLALPTGRAAALSFEAVATVFNRSGQLNFEVEREHVKGMLDHPGSTYRGDVTVVFDAEM